MALEQIGLQYSCDLITFTSIKSSHQSMFFIAMNYKGFFILLLALLKFSQANVAKNHDNGQYLLVHVPDEDLHRVVHGYDYHHYHHHDHSSSSSSSSESHEDLGDVLPGHPLPMQLRPPMPPRRPPLWYILQKMRQRRRPMIAWRPMVVYGHPGGRGRPQAMPMMKSGQPSPPQPGNPFMK